MDADPDLQDPWPEEPPADVWDQGEYDPDLPATWPSEEKRAWSITNDTIAEWAMKKYARAEQEIKRVRDHAAEEIARINQRVEEMVATSIHDLDFFEYHLTRYHSRLQEAGKADKTYHLLNGDLTARKLPGRIEVTESDEVLAILQRRGMARVAVAPDKKAIKVWLDAHPKSSIPGVEYVTDEVSFKPKPGKHEQPAFLPLPDVEDEAA